MTIVGAGEVPISPTFPGFRNGVLEQINTTASEAGGRFKAAFGAAVKGIGVGIATGVAAVTASAAAIGAKGLDRALNIQDAKAQLTGLGHSAESVTTIMESALASVKGTAFGLDQSAQIAASSVAAGIAPGEALTRVLKLTADSATIAKAPLSEMGSIINKVATNQKLTTETMQQFQDRGIPILQAVASQMGVTADEAAKMVSRGEIDFATFQNALESSVGGAALSSGTTARGALANIGAAFSRLGAMFVQSGVDGAPTLFSSIANAVDRAAEALKPYAAAFSERLAPAMAALSAYIDTIDFGRIVGGLEGIYALVVQGDFTSKFREAFNLEEDSTVVDRVLTIRDGITGLYSLIVQGDFTSALRNAFNVEEDSGFVSFILGARDAVSSFFSSFSQGDFGGAFNSIGTSLQTLQPAFASFGAELPKIGQAMSQLVAGGVTVLTQVLSFLADNVDTIVQFMPLIVGGFIAWRVASSAVANATLALRTGELAATPIYFANNVMRNNSVRIERQLALAKAAATGATSTNTAATNLNTAATARGRIATLAANTATRIAAVGQRVLNAAMSANPIGLIITAITALVAGLIWFFTQTELGQQIWANVTAAIGTAMTWLWETILQPVFTAIGAIATWLYENVIAPVVAGIVLYVQAWAAIFQWLWENILQPLFSAIGAIAIWLYENVIAPVVAGIVMYVQAWAAIFQWLWETILQPLFAAIGAGITWVYENMIRPTVDAIVAGIQFAGDAIAGIRTVIENALAGIGTWLVDSGRALIQGFIDGIQGAIGFVEDVVGGVMDFVGGFFPHSPAKRGPFSGSGWTAVFSGGEALAEQFFSGFDPEAGGGPAPMLNKAMVALTAVPPTAQAAARDNAAPGTGDQGKRSEFTQINNWPEMDADAAFEAAGQKFAATARRVGP